MTEIYCMRCRSKTQTHNEQTKRVNNRNQLTGICSVCKAKKSVFTK